MTAGLAYLWQADGPSQGCRGVTGRPRSARTAAAALLRSGAADWAVIEEAVAGLGMRGLEDAWQPTGRRWRASLGREGRVRWVHAPPASAA